MRWSLISVRLIIAISVLGIVTSGALLTALFSFNEMREGYDEIATTTIPELVEAARIGQTAQAVASTAPVLASVSSTVRARAIEHRITDQLALLDEYLLNLEALIGDTGVASDQIAAIRSNRDSLIANLDQLKLSVNLRLEQDTALRALSTRSRKVMDQLNSKDMIAIQEGAYESADGSHLAGILWRRALQSVLFELEQVRNVTSARARQISLENAVERLAEMQALRGQAYRGIGAVEQEVVDEITADVTDLVNSDEGVFAIVALRAAALRQQDGLLTANVFLARNFIAAVTELALVLRVETQDRSLAFADTAREKWTRLVTVMVLTLLSVVLLSIYVRKRIVDRVASLRDAMMARLRGDDVKINVTGADEITEIGQAAVFFADAVAEREERLKAAKEEAEDFARKADAANRAKSVFLANMSHELRTPLNAVIGFSELIQMGTNNPERDKEYAGDIRNSGVHLLSLINQLLDYSKIEAGENPLELEPLSVIEVFEAIERLMAMQFERAAITPVFIAEPDVKVMADLVAFRQIVINLLSNSVKFGYEGSDVFISAEPDGDWVVITVADQGVGIGEEALPKVLQPFHQESSTYIRQVGGTGLGLAIVNSLVRLHEGSVEIESVKGEGTTVRIRMPRVISASHEDETVHGIGPATFEESVAAHTTD